ncbi:hypothetical protein [Algibacter lectus]|uniref:DUF2116 family Zn-ribbon domain-containing protein n=1 Tax=Algibacter lectus TaxID=221126 RepID=A0A4R8MJL0_9FLAO|nr:hypothetical protein [Algibacter lectus]MWW24762.1 hypothetical protein [Algibacter lectus]TDY64827.1 hypothetical protein DFQ06_1750 [Algibacter lectus]SFD26840.1 hypothetical protein SAMN04489722_106310 [Algibacter lectus]
MKLKNNECLACGKELIGRSDKIYCDLHCKSSYHYRKSLDEAPRFYNKVDNQLKLNRKILKNFNKSGKATVRAKVVLELGFNPKYFTHYWKNKKHDVYLFVYEFGFLKKKENNVEKYILIKWQEYME